MKLFFGVNVAKKKKPVASNQKDLSSFVETHKSSEKKPKEKIKKEEIKKPKEERPKLEEFKKSGEKKPKIVEETALFEDNETELEESDEIEENFEENASIESEEIEESDNLINVQVYQAPESSETPFGLKEGNIVLGKKERESLSSRYISYLIKKGEIVQNLSRGLLLDVDYDGEQNKAYCKFYDLDTDEIKIWIDTTNHEPYCLSKEPKKELEKLEYTVKIDKDTKIKRKLTEYEGFARFEEIKRYELLKDEEITMTRIYGKSPTNIGGSGNNIKNILAQNNKKAWEADIRYHLNYIFDRQLIPGLIYKVKNGKIEKLDFEKSSEDSKKMADELRNLFKKESPEMQEFAEKFLDIFLAPIPDVKRLAMDIEITMGEEDFRIPNPRLANQEIISVSFASTDGLKLVYMLEREGLSFNKLHEKFPPDAKVRFFKSEKDLITETFRIMWQYPVIITFNGDNFDLNYMFHRANNFRINKDLNPIQVKRGFGALSKAECNLRKGIHIDLFSFFINRSISGYAFGGAYANNTLNAISIALLGKMKHEFVGEIHEIGYDDLSWYNLNDSLLTLELTQFNDSLVWNLIVLLCRITKMPIHDMIRRQISTWIQNIFYFEHRRKNCLIPRRSEISEYKPGGHSKAVIEGKGFAGAYVVTPIPGIHFNVAVMDFASLYPSIIKEYNLSYETVVCPHKDCEDNFIKGAPYYYVCTHKKGIFAYVVGFFREIRVKYFKPKSSDKTLSEKQRNYYKTIQQALKVFINGSYGVFGSQNFPLFCLPVAESTTGIGQYSIKQTIKKSEELGIKVLYGDTDSVFLLNPTKDQMNEISNWSKKELDLDLEEEKTYQFLALSQLKKNYIGINKGTKSIDVKGLVAKKKNAPEFIKKVFYELLEILKNITNEEEFKSARQHIIEIVRTNLKKIGKSNAFSLEDYTIHIALQKNIDDYLKVMPQHVSVAKEMMGRELANNESEGAMLAIKNKYKKGYVVRFIKTKGIVGAKAPEFVKLQDIDIKKYKELLKSALEQVLDALGISFEEISGIKKMDAFI